MRLADGGEKTPSPGRISDTAIERRASSLKPLLRFKMLD